MQPSLCIRTMLKLSTKNAQKLATCNWGGNCTSQTSNPVQAMSETYKKHPYKGKSARTHMELLMKGRSEQPPMQEPAFTFHTRNQKSPATNVSFSAWVVPFLVCLYLVYGKGLAGKQHRSSEQPDPQLPYLNLIHLLLDKRTASEFACAQYAWPWKRQSIESHSLA